MNEYPLRSQSKSDGASGPMGSAPMRRPGLTASGGMTNLAPAEARAQLLVQTPEETDQGLLAWLESSLGVVASQRVRRIYPKEGGYRRVNEGYDFSGLEANLIEPAIEAVEAAMTRPTHDQVEEWIGGLAAVTASRVQSDDTAEIALGLYVGRLAQYPADVVKRVCMDFALRRDKPNWFPTLSEIDEACEKAAEPRTQLLKALKSRPMTA